MIVEYILLLTAFVAMLMKITYYAPLDAFQKAGPRLGARIEKHLATGRGFSEDPALATTWKPKP